MEREEHPMISTRRQERCRRQPGPSHLASGARVLHSPAVRAYLPTGVAALCIFVGMGCGNRAGPSESRDAGARSIYAYFAGHELPASVRALQVEGDLSSEGQVWCRFTAPAEVIDEIIASGYDRWRWDEIRESMTPGVPLTAFTPPWDPAGARLKESYSQGVEIGGYGDRLYLAVDRESGMVHATRYRMGIMEGR